MHSCEPADDRGKPTLEGRPANVCHCQRGSNFGRLDLASGEGGGDKGNPTAGIVGRRGRSYASSGKDADGDNDGGRAGGGINVTAWTRPRAG
jgi:hypothetical protein